MRLLIKLRVREIPSESKYFWNYDNQKWKIIRQNEKLGIGSVYQEALLPSTKDGSNSAI